jgi:hypothetical protein
MRYVAIDVPGINQPVRQQVTCSENSSYNFRLGDKCKVVPVFPTSDDQKYFGLIGILTRLSDSPGKACLEIEGRGTTEIDICNLVAPSLVGFAPSLFGFAPSLFG